VGLTQESKDPEDKGTVGKDLGGIRFTPIRTVEAGTFRFETWVEEGRAKLRETEEQGKGKSAASSDIPKINLEKSKFSFSASSGDSIKM
jgi:mitotic spindle assembly checkpoint protein MAD2B